MALNEKISVFIIALNEADRICEAITSVIEWVDEVIVVDSGSTDDTMALAASLGAKVWQNPWRGYGRQKQFAEQLCTNDWVLNIDADERVSPELAREIATLFGHPAPGCFGYLVGITDLFAGQTHDHALNYRKWAVRLYHKQKAGFSSSPVHDSVIIREGRTGKLAAPILHYSFRTIAHAVDKLNYYSTMQCNDMMERGKKVISARLYSEFFFAFLKVYLLRRYALRGKEGFIYAIIYAFSRFLRLAKVHEKRISKKNGQPPR